MRRFSLWFIIVLIALALVVDIPFPKIKLLGRDLQINFPLKLGLDLQGGIEIVLQAQMDNVPQSDRNDTLESVRSVIERRVNPQGVSEILVQNSKIGDKYRVIVDLPGVKDASAAASLIGQTAKLEFREMPATLSAQESEATKSGIPVIFFAKPTNLTGADLKPNGAQVTYGSSRSARSGPQITLEFTDEGAKKFADITRKNVGKPLAIFLDDQILEAPIVQQEIDGGNAVITGSYTAETAKQRASLLNAGALKVPVKIVDQRSVGPELGQESIRKSLTAGIVGLTIIAVYMVSYYGVWGLIADFALIIYTLLVFGIFKTGLFVIPPITLTLAGTAGFILSIGMAVDANILIFERMKEEIRWGKSKLLALDLGFKRAWSSIWASNVSSLITAMILYSMGQSLIKGFAITLAIGVLVSMFTSYIVTRTFLRLIIK